MNDEEQDETIFPLLKPWVEVFEITASNVVIKTEELLLQLCGNQIASLLSALNGATTTSILFTKYESSMVQDVLDRLQKFDLIAWVKWETKRHLIPQGNPLPNIHISDPFCIGIQQLEDALRTIESLNGLKRKLRIVLTNSYIRPDLQEKVENVIESGEPWILVKPEAMTVWFSPVFQAKMAPCWDCFTKRLVAQDDSLAFLLLKGKYQRRCINESFAAVPGLLTQEVVQAISLKVREYLTGRGGILETGELLQLDVRQAGYSKHHVLSYPGCTICSQIPRPGSFLQLKTFVEPKDRETFESLWGKVQEKVGHLIDPVTGVVAELGVGNSDLDQVVCVAIASYADPTKGKLCKFTVDEASGCIKRSHKVSRTAFGGGYNASDARARAVLEALERYCGIFQGTEPTILASFNELGKEALHPNILMNYSAKQLYQSNLSKPETPRELRIPKPFDENERIYWTPLESLSGGKMYAPTAYCYDCCDTQPDTSYCIYDTNGSAIAFTLEDAIVRGFLEVVERDAISIWWYNRITRPVVQICTFSNQFVDRVAAHHDALGRKLTVFDISSDINVTVFAAMSTCAGKKAPLLGFGAHFNAHQALISALTELGQALCFVKQENKKWESFAWLGQSHLTDQATEVRCADDYVERLVRPEIQDCVVAATAAGINIFFRNCTRDDIGLPAVKVITPGLRHIWPRFGPGRLWDVPVKLDWLKQPNSVEDLNPEYLRL